MKLVICSAIAVLVFASVAGAADFGSRGGPEPANVDEIISVLRQDAYDMELLISYGTSKGGSAGHLALALRDPPPGEDIVYSANFYADRSKEHAKGFYTDDLMVRIPKREYLFGTASSLGETASFGLDYGEIYKRSVIGIRVYGVPTAEKEAIAAYFRRINDDYHRRAPMTEYHDREIKYDYLLLNCAKTIGAAFRFGAGYKDLEVTSSRLSSRRKIVTAMNANLPTEMAMKLLEQWNARGYRLDVVMYRKYPGSTHIDPHDAEKVAFKDLPNRFPSVLSLDFRREAAEYEDFDNLQAMYLLYNLGRYSVQVNAGTKLLEIDKGKQAMAYPDALRLATENAQADSALYQRRIPVRPLGLRIGEVGERSGVQ